ncbi:MAG: hypothetical protein KJ687_03690, partial [Proteobacteria bacterium]|nr:hypothetical protein [Pseudomonadota bacterium]
TYSLNNEGINYQCRTLLGYAIVLRGETIQLLTAQIKEVRNEEHTYYIIRYKLYRAGKDGFGTRSRTI